MVKCAYITTAVKSCCIILAIVVIIMFQGPPLCAEDADSALPEGMEKIKFGHANIIVWKNVAAGQRRVLLGSRLMEVTGRVQREGDVLHLVAERLRDRSALLGQLMVRSRDFH